MGDESKVTIGNTTYDIDRDINTASARINSNASQVATKGDGEYFRTGVSGNFYQAAGEHITGGFNLSRPGINADGSSLSNAQWAGALATTAILAYPTAKTGLGIVKATNSQIRTKAFNQVPVTDANGKKRWYNKETIEGLGEEVSRDGKGGYRFAEGSIEELNQKIDHRSALNPGEKIPHNIDPTKMTSNMAAAVDKTAPIKSPLINDMDNYTTKEEISATREKIEKLKPNEAGKKVLGQALDEAKTNYTEGTPERTRLDQISRAIEQGRPVPAEDIARLTGYPTQMTKDGSVDVYKMGTKAKNGAFDALDKKEIEVLHGHPHAQSDTHRVPSTTRKSV